MNNIFRTTKCFGVNGQGKCKGAFPKGFLSWIQNQGWWAEKRIYLCGGMVDDRGGKPLIFARKLIPRILKTQERPLCLMRVLIG
jgi:hypothetical protein